MRYKKLTALMLAGVMALCLVACGTKDSVTDNSEKKQTTENTSVMEQTTEAEQPEEESVEEPVDEVEKPVEETTEDSTKNLSNEEWIASIIVEKPTFLILNDTTKERKVLKDCEKYTLLEGDELALKIPSRWIWQRDNIQIYNSIENKYDFCGVYDLNYDLIDENTEFTVTFNNRDDEPVTTTVYLTK